MIGASGFASEVTQYIEDNKEFEIIGYFDINKNEYDRYDFQAPFLGNENDYDFSKSENIVIAISDSALHISEVNV